MMNGQEKQRHTSGSGERSYSTTAEETEHYTGLNRLFHSDALQAILRHIDDGTLSEFFDDWKWIFSFSRKYKWIIVFYTLVGSFGSTLSLGSAWLSRTLINIVVGQQRDRLWLLLGAMLGMTAFSLLLSSLNSRIFTRISIYVGNDIQAEIFDRIIDARWAELSRYPSGDLLNRFNGDVGTIAANAINWIPNLIINIYTFIVTFVVLFRLDSIMAWIAILSAPFLLVMSRWIMRRMKEYRKRILELNSGMMSFEVETFFNFDMIKSFGVFDTYSKKLRSWQQRYKDYSLDYNRFEIRSRILLTLVSTAVSMAAFGYCLYRLWNGQILYGDMTFFLQQRAAGTHVGFALHALDQLAGFLFRCFQDGCGRVFGLFRVLGIDDGAVFVRDFLNARRFGLRVPQDALGDPFYSIDSHFACLSSYGFFLQRSHQQDDGSQQGKDGVEFNDTAHDGALEPVIGLLRHDVDGGRRHSALGDRGEQAAQRHRHAGGENG